MESYINKEVDGEIVPKSRKELLPKSLTCAQCTACKEVFSSTRNFDAHRKWNYHYQTGYCVDPSTVKLILGANDTWITEQTWFKEGKE